MCQQGQKQNQHRHKDNRKKRQDQQARAEPVEPHLLQAVGDRIEQIGEREACRERHQHAAEDIKHERQQNERREPE